MPKAQRARKGAHAKAGRLGKSEDDYALSTPSFGLPAEPAANGTGAAGTATDAGASPLDLTGGAFASRGAKRRERFLKKLNFGRRLEAKAAAHKRERVSGKMGELQDLRGALAEVERVGSSSSSMSSAAAAAGGQSTSASAGKKGKVMRNKTRQRVAGGEVGHFAQVLALPAFQANPLAAIQQHLQNTLAGGEAPFAVGPRTVAPPVVSFQNDGPNGHAAPALPAKVKRPANNAKKNRNQMKGQRQQQRGGSAKSSRRR